MLVALLTALAAAPIYWFVVPERARKDYLAAASLVGLAFYDLWQPVVVAFLVVLLHAALRLVADARRAKGRAVLLAALTVLVALFSYNKLASRGVLLGALSTQGTLVFLGISYFVLKAAAILIETWRGTLAAPSFARLLRWMVFLPIFPSGPIEEFRHFDEQSPAVDRDRILRGLERILFGCVRAVVFAPLLGDWAMPILQSPAGHGQTTLLLAAYAFTLRFYFDFAGYSDIAIGLAAIYGYEIQENFDHPLTRRNIGGLWQHWHMTLTAWMRLYLFIPLSRAIMRRGGLRWHTTAIACGHLAAMLFCGVWHEIKWEYVLWGLGQALALIWISLGARPAGKRLPPAFLGWWRGNPAAHALSCFLTFNTFSLLNVLIAARLSTTLDFFARLAGAR